ncbi:SitI6 family double-CXXCG motif immunity protein [Hyalangium gracile]
MEGVQEPRYSGSHNVERRWFLPGVHCPQCDAVWGGPLGCLSLRGSLPPAGSGEIHGSARGGLCFLYSSWMLLMRREALERLQAEGVQGLKGCHTELRFRQKNPPELLELELLPRGQAHPDCLPEYRPEPCTKCGRKGWKRPEELILRASSVPPELDAFRLEDFPTAIIASERFVETARRLGYEQDIAFRVLPLR